MQCILLFRSQSWVCMKLLQNLPHQSVCLRHHIWSHPAAVALDGLPVCVCSRTSATVELDNSCCKGQGARMAWQLRKPQALACPLTAPRLHMPVVQDLQDACDAPLLGVASIMLPIFPSPLHAQVCANGDPPRVELHHGVQRHLPVLPGHPCPQLPAAACRQAIRRVCSPVCGDGKTE